MRLLRIVVLVLVCVAVGVGATLGYQRLASADEAHTDLDVAKELQRQYLSHRGLEYGDTRYGVTCDPRGYPASTWDCSIGPEEDGSLASLLVEWDRFLAIERDGKLSFEFRGSYRPNDPYG